MEGGVEAGAGVDGGRASREVKTGIQLRVDHNVARIQAKTTLVGGVVIKVVENCSHRRSQRAADPGGLAQDDVIGDGDGGGEADPLTFVVGERVVHDPAGTVPAGVEAAYGSVIVVSRILVDDGVRQRVRALEYSQSASQAVGGRIGGAVFFDVDCIDRDRAVGSI